MGYVHAKIKLKNPRLPKLKVITQYVVGLPNMLFRAKGEILIKSKISPFGRNDKVVNIR